jgi:hypothetical protein
MSSSREMNTQLGPWQMSDIAHLDYGAKAAIIKELCLKIKDHRIERLGLQSRTLMESLKDKKINVETKWLAFINYCQDADNNTRATYKNIIKIIPKAFENHTRDMFQKGHLEQIARYLQFSEVVAAKLISLSIKKGIFKKEYVSNMDFTRPAYKKEFCRNEIFNKTIYGTATPTDGDDKKDMHALTVGLSIVVESVVRTPIAFFAYQGRHFNEQTRVTETFSELSQLSDLASLDDKISLMKEIAKRYEKSIKATTSDASLTLAHDMEGDKEPLVAWRGLINYMVAQQNRVFTNNGTRLFNIIAQAAKEQLAKLYVDNSLPSVSSLSLS